MATTYRIRFCSVILILLITVSTYAADTDPGTRIKNDITTLSCDAMQGRDTGSAQFFKAGQWLADQFKALGLQPGGDNNGYIQVFEFPLYENTFRYPRLSINDRRYYGEDGLFRMARYSGGGKVSGQVVWLGYGLSAKELKVDHYTGVPLKDKIALVISGAPNEDSKWEPFSSDSVKVDLAFAAGAKAVLFIQNPSIRERQYGAYVRLRPRQHHPGFLVASLDDHLVTSLLASPDEMSRELPKRVRDAADQTLDRVFKPELLEKKVSLQHEAKYIPAAKAWNIVALLPGSDPALAQEWVAFGGHFDHIGVEYGRINNGADDNASGTAMVLELARRFVQSGQKPKRSMLFAAWGGEELGLLGSEYFCKHLDKKVVVYFNFDMVGLGTNLGIPGRYYGPAAWEIIKAGLDKTSLEFLEPSRGGPGGSDHTPFLQKGIAAFALMTGPWEAHPSYHTPAADPEKIDAGLLAKVADVSEKMGRIMADHAASWYDPDGEARYIHKVAQILNLQTMPVPKETAGLDTLFSRYDIDGQLLTVRAEQGNSCVFADLFSKLNTAQEKFGSREPAGFGRRGAGRRDQARAYIGLDGLSAMAAEPEQIKAMVKLGAQFIAVDAGKDSWLCRNDSLSAEAKKLAAELAGEKVLWLCNGYSAGVNRQLLQTVKNPLLLAGPAPADSLWQLIARKKALWAVTTPLQADYSTTVSDLEQIKKAGYLDHTALHVSGDPAARSDLFNLTRALKQAGWDERQIRNVLGENASRKFSELSGERQGRRPM